ncbi:FmdB family zinc ribbon protein [Salidesulfovibrio onnuriiensis]|uniref:FmdB family zinc ribbon protein n=1 Tax=Salidesulfovibrio onnuriiensis TaxID=2583823 RepID=UPI0011CA0894|nr:zinc ribbon domain-containing protein [Salidesulfovibrio onnuriiensis]
MPIYEYQCEKCGNVFEEWQSGFEERELPCPQCQGNSKRMISNTSFVLKGSGWYVTDYAGKNPSNGNGGGNGNGSETQSASDAGASESKASESKASESKSGTESASTGSAS